MYVILYANINGIVPKSSYSFIKTPIINNSIPNNPNPRDRVLIIPNLAFKVDTANEPLAPIKSKAKVAYLLRITSYKANQFN